MIVRHRTAVAMTLSEVVVSSLIVAGLFVAAMQGASGVALRGAIESDRSQAVLLAEELLSEITALPFTDPQGLAEIKISPFPIVGDAVIKVDDGVIELTASVPTAIAFDVNELQAEEASRADFDDIDDYNNWSASPPEDREGNAYADLTGWTRSVMVAWVEPDEPTQVAPLTRTAKRIVVTVSRGTTVLAQLESIRHQSE